MTDERLAELKALKPGACTQFDCRGVLRACVVVKPMTPDGTFTIRYKAESGEIIPNAMIHATDIVADEDVYRFDQ